MGFWVFMLAMNLIIPLSMIFLGKYFSKHAPGLGKDADAVGKIGGLLCLAQLPVMLYTIFPTERALKKTFDKDGNRK